MCDVSCWFVICGFFMLRYVPCIPNMLKFFHKCWILSNAFSASIDYGFIFHFDDVVSEWVKSLSCVRLFVTPWTVAHQAPPSMGFSRQEYWSGLPFPSLGDLPNPGIKPRSPALQADALTSEPPGYPLDIVVYHTNWFADVKPPLYLWNKSHLNMVYNYFNVLLN